VNLLKPLYIEQLAGSNLNQNEHFRNHIDFYCYVAGDTKESAPTVALFPPFYRYKKHLKSVF
jgi:hypothetical protein